VKDVKELWMVLVFLRARKREVEGRLQEAIINLLPEDKQPEMPWDLFFGTAWDCPTSPTSHCVYDRRKDLALDRCLFCGDPAER